MRVFWIAREVLQESSPFLFVIFLLHFANMLDIKFIRENTDLVKNAIAVKGVAIDFDAFLKTDAERLHMMQILDEHRAHQNRLSDTVQSAPADERPKIIEELKQLKETIKTLEAQYAPLDALWNDFMLRIPNIPDISAPVGKDESENVPIKIWGEKTQFDFEPKDHIEIMTTLGMLDLERGVKVHGFRGYFLKGDAVRLCFAIWNYAMDFWGRKGFNPIIPPINTKREPLVGCAFVPQGEPDIYKAQDESYFVGTSEVPLMGMYMDEVLDRSMFPVKMLGFSPCFRLEAGSYAKDVKGLIRVHEFYKFEQVVLCEGSHEQSVQFHDEIQRNVEEFIETLGIPYQVVDACTGDMGLGKVRMYDTNLWVPKEQTYREISSASYFHDFQTRRLNIRYRDEMNQLRFAHSLNCTAIPTPRILVSLVENCQTADGSIRIPEVLQKYFGSDTIRKV